MSDAAANHRFGRRSPVFWDAEGRRPLDRWGRSAEEVRHHVAFVSGLVQELRGFAGRCQQVLLGREAGARFLGAVRRKHRLPGASHRARRLVCGAA